MTKALLAAAFLLAGLPSWAAQAADEGGRIRLTVFHTNDIHGWILSRPDSKTKKPVGGMATAAQLVKDFRATGQPMLLVDDGDFFQGTPEGSIPRGKSMVELFNAMGYDAVTLGNHEFDYGLDVVKALTAEIRAPVVDSNILNAATGLPVDFVKPYVIKDFGKFKVGIFGILTSRMGALSFEKNIAGLRFVDEIAAARQAVAELRRRGADVVILLSHVGWEKPTDPPFTGDQDIAAAVPGIDLIVGGHSHTPLPVPFREPTNGTLIVQNGGYLTTIGRAVLEIDPARKKVVSAAGELVRLLPETIGQDEETLKIVRRYEEEVGRQLEVVVSSSSAGLFRSRDSESGMGDWLTDCTRKWAKTDIAFQNAGGIRADIVPGPVSLRNIFEIMPFDNLLATIYMKGGSLRRLLDQAVAKSPGSLQVSGLSFRYDREASEGSRATDIAVGGLPLADDQVYSVSAPDFVVQGGDEYGAFSEATDKAITETLIRDLLTWCAKKYSPIVTPEGGRIVRR